MPALTSSSSTLVNERSMKVWLKGKALWDHNSKNGGLFVVNLLFHIPVGVLKACSLMSNRGRSQNLNFLHIFVALL